jgi:antitoxin MazE
MVAKIQRWGNSLAVRIPNVIAKELQISQGSEIEMKQLDDKIIIAPKHEKYDLKHLVSKINRSNIHTEIKTHEAVGNEIW